MKNNYLMLNNYLQISCIVIWFLLIGAGFFSAMSYHTQAGENVEVPRRLIEGAELLNLNEQVNSVICFIHPLCPCSNATVAELELLSENPEIQAQVVVVLPYPQGEEEWIDEGMLRHGSTLRKSAIIGDPGGEITSKFGVKTSGHTLVYRNHELKFSGGLTPARGHVADRWNRVPVEEFFRDEVSSVQTTPCYGCRLFTAKPQ